MVLPPILLPVLVIIVNGNNKKARKNDVQIIFALKDLYLEATKLLFCVMQMTG